MIHINNLSFRYGREPLFSQLNMEVEAGNICGLLGKNGAGKTTLLKLLCGLLFQQDGESRIMEHAPKNRSPQLLQEIIFLPEEFDLPPVTARQYAWLYAPFYPRFETNTFERYLEEFEVEPTKKLTKYSYGQKKKFLIAFGLATDCQLLLLDEPTNGLDIPSKRQFRRTVASALTEERLFIISTHQARDLENLIDPVIILDEGQIIFNHSVEDISSRLAAYRLPEVPDPEAVLYMEEQVDGYLVVTENTEQEASKIDLELLFNAVTQNWDKVSDVFSRGGAI